MELVQQADAVTMLLVAGRAEENELIATSLRSYYPECRIEAVASTDDEVVRVARHLSWRVGSLPA